MTFDFPSNTANPTFFRTYSRLKEDLKTKESVNEVFERGLDGLFKLGSYTDEEQELIRTNLYSLHTLFSGRWMWVGGMPFLEKEKNYYASYNCIGMSTEGLADFGRCFNLLMQGCGVGASITKPELEKLPPIITGVTLLNITDQEDIGSRTENVQDHTYFYDGTLYVGDSREAWVDAVLFILKLFTTHGEWDIFIDLKSPRKAGTPIKGFGGVANPTDLRQLFIDTVEMLNSYVYREWDSFLAAWLYARVAKCTVAGNVRRSAELMQGSEDDPVFTEMKTGMWQQTPEGKWSIDPKKDPLRMANHSRMFFHKPSYQDLEDAVRKQYYSGEGAIAYAPMAIIRCNVDLLDTDGKQNYFHALYLCNPEKALDYLSELSALKGLILTPEERYHRIERWRANPCFVANTLITTREGQFPIVDLVGKEVDIWDGDQWVTINNFRVTGENQQVYTITLKSGDKITATPYHTFVLESCFVAKLYDLKIGDKLLTHNKGKTMLPELGWNQIVSIEDSGIVDKVYCCTVPTNNRVALTCGVITGQCVEVLGKDFLCVSGDTNIITRNSLVKIKDVVGSEIDVWNGDRWSTVKPIKTGSNQKLYRVSFTDGSYLDVTDNHNFYVRDRFQKTYSKVSTLDLMSFSKYQIHTEPFSVDYTENEGLQIPLDGAYTLGFAVGDGTYNSKGYTVIRLHGEKIKVNLKGNRLPVEQIDGYNCLSQLVTQTGIDGFYLRDLKNNPDTLRDIFSWSKEAILQFIAGLADSDGSNTLSNSIRIYISQFERASIIQLLLSKVGIRSSVNLMSEKGSVTNKGGRSEDVYYLQITDCADIPCQRLDVSGGHACKNKGKWQNIESVIELPSTEDSFCFEEPFNHKAVFGNTLTGNCNLAEIHLNQLDPLNRQQQKEAFRAGGLITASLLAHRFDDEKFRYSREIDPIVGVSFTGLFDFFVNLFGADWLKWWQAGRPEEWVPPNSEQLQKVWFVTDCYPEEVSYGNIYRRIERMYLSFWRNCAMNAVWEYCDRNNLRKPNRVTVVQPAGTKSLLTGASCGYHPPKASRYIRRITFAKNDPIALACIDYGYTVVPSQSDKDANGQLLDDPFDPRCTEWLVEIPVEVPWAAIADEAKLDPNQFSAVAQFDFFMQVQTYYTQHNTSSTIELRENEIGDLAQAIHTAIQTNQPYFSTALLSRFDSFESFPRLPFEPVSQEKYTELVAGVLARRKSEDFYALMSQYQKGVEFEDDRGSVACESEVCSINKK